MEPSEEFVDKDITGKKDEVQFQVPILPNLNNKTPFQLMNIEDLLALSDIIQEYVQFPSLVKDHVDFQKIVKQEASNLIKCIETSLESTNTSLLVESIEMPRDTYLITFIAEEGSLTQEQIQIRANVSREKKERLKLRKGKLVKVSKPVTVKVMDIRWLVHN